MTRRVSRPASAFAHATGQVSLRARDFSFPSENADAIGPRRRPARFEGNTMTRENSLALGCRRGAAARLVDSIRSALETATPIPSMQVLVTATRAMTVRCRSARRLVHDPAIVPISSSARPRYVSDILRDVPGVSVSRSGSLGGFTQVRMRGAEANHTLVLIDGMEASDPYSGEFDFATLIADDVARVEGAARPAERVVRLGRDRRCDQLHHAERP